MNEQMSLGPFPHSELPHSLQPPQVAQTPHPRTPGTLRVGCRGGEGEAGNGRGWASTWVAVPN